MKIFFQVSVLLLLEAVSLLAADPSGKWSASVPGRNGGNTTIAFNLKAEGDKLSGTVTGFRGETPISDGKVEGDNLSFNVVREFNGNQMKQSYKGALEGSTIHFTVIREGAQGAGGDRKFDAIKE